jgi:N-methylhydantoinase A
MPGALSALGILMSDVTKDHSRTLLWDAQDKLPAARLTRELRRLRAIADTEFAKEGWKGKVHRAPSLDLRYKGQGFEINVPLDGRSLARFHAEHAKRYGYSRPENAVEVVTVRLRSWIQSPPVKIKPTGRGRGTSRAPVIERSELKAIRGPATITEYSATTYVPKGWEAAADRVGNLLLTH